MFPLTPPCRHLTPRPKCVRCRHNCRVRDGLCNRCFAFEHGLPVVTDARSIVNHEALRRADELRDTTDIGPCVAVPGSVEKLAVLMARADCHVPLFDDGDREPGEVRRAVFDDDGDEDSDFDSDFDDQLTRRAAKRFVADVVLGAVEKLLEEE